MALRVNVVCRNYRDDRVVPRFSRYLAERLGWMLTAAPSPAGCDAMYLSGYFEAQLVRAWPAIPVAAYFTHREEEPPGNEKARLYDQVAGRVQMRVATARMYARALAKFGPTAQAHPPVERERFVIPKRRGRSRRLVAGFSGYTYRNQRKGEDLARAVMASKIGQRVTWMAAGRGWPAPMQRYSWQQMPAFYQSLDILVVTARVEGVPMPPLEALACGVSLVVPRGVGLLDELPDTPGIHRYARGDARELARALEQAVAARMRVDREALRAITEPYTVEAWCADHAAAIAAACDAPDAAMEETMTAEKSPPPRKRRAGARGIYVVAFGDPSRNCALRLMNSIKKHMPDVPVALCAAKKIGPEDVFIRQPDSDVGGRRAKLRAYELAPQEWRSVLYLDADTLVTAPIHRFFEWVEDGWEFVICKDPHLMDTMHSFERRNNKRELAELQQEIRTLHALQINGGVWAFARNARVQRFFRRWLENWEKHAQRDQGALLRALYAEPMRVLWLGNEWNTFEKYCRGITTAGLMHYPGDARRWKGAIPGRIDSQEAWRMVKEFERGQAEQRRGRRR